VSADLAPYRCDATEARELTDKINASVEKTWRLLLNAHEWNAWGALGYDTWEAYVQAEFGIGRSRSYQLLDQARVVREVEAAVSTNVDIKESHARELALTLRAINHNRTQIHRALMASIPDKIGDAHLALDTQEMTLLRHLSEGALASEEARGFLGSIPTVGELVPRVVLREIEQQMDGQS
jgi:hypothetical protein